MYYNLTVTLAIKRLETLKKLLEKVQIQAKTRSISDQEVLALKLAPDMYPLVKQIQIVTDNSKGAVGRLTGKDIPSYEDNENSFAELAERLQKTIDFLLSFVPEDFQTAEQAKVEMPYFKDMHFTAEGYLLEFYIPNVHFHFTTAYAICRANGFEVGKQDFMGELPLIANS